MLQYKRRKMWSQQLYTEGRYESDFQGQVELIV